MTSRTVPEATYPPGTYGPVELTTLPGSSEGFRITFTRVAWGGTTSDLALTVVTEWSRDNGASWQEIRRTTFPGGVVLGRDGQPVTTCGLSQTWPGEAGPNGRVKLRGSDVRVTAIVAQTLTTAITLEAI